MDVFFGKDIPESKIFENNPEVFKTQMFLDNIKLYNTEYETEFISYLRGFNKDFSLKSILTDDEKIDDILTGNEKIVEIQLLPAISGKFKITSESTESPDNFSIELKYNDTTIYMRKIFQVITYSCQIFYHNELLRELYGTHYCIPQQLFKDPDKEIEIKKLFF